LHGQPVYLVQFSQCRTNIHSTLFAEIMQQTGNRYQLNYKKASFNDAFYVTIPRYFDGKKQTFGTGPIEVSNQSIININWHLNEYFEQTLCNYYQVHNSTLGIGVEKSIQLFYQQFGITENMISQDALTKIIQRRRKAVSIQPVVVS
jgi:hypothetical protein